MMKSRKKRTACAIAAYLALTLLPNYAWAGSHDAGQSSSDTDSEVTITDTGNCNYGVEADGTEVTIGNSGDPGAITVNVASGTSTVYGTKVDGSGSLSVYGKNVALDASTTSGYADAYGQYISDGKSSVVADSLDIETTSDTGCAAGIYNYGENTIKAGSLDIYAISKGNENQNDDAAGIVNYGINSIAANQKVVITAIADDGEAVGVYNEVKYTEGVNTITADSVAIGASGAKNADGIDNYYGSNTIVATGAVSIKAYATDNDSYAYGIFNEGVNSIAAGSLAIAVSAGDEVTGIYNIDSNTINADGNVSITAGDTVTKGNAFGIWNKDYNLIKAGGDVSITATSANGMAQGIYNEEEGENSIEAESVEITANAGDAARGIYIDSNSVNSIKADENVSITAYSANASAWGISNYGENSIEAGSVDITASTGGAAWGIYNIASDSITADGNVSIEATSASESAWGISNYGENSIEAGSLDITASAENNATGIEIASDSNSITADGDVSIEAISVSGSARGIRNSGDNRIEAESVEITANAGDAARGIYIDSTGVNSIKADENVSITAYSANASARGIYNLAINSIEAGSVDITASTGGTAWGIYNIASDSITADGNVIITADATSNGSTDGLAYGIYNEGENSIEAGSVEVTVSAAYRAMGVYNLYTNSITADGEVSIAATSDSAEAYGIYNEGENSIEAGSLAIAVSAGDEVTGIYNIDSNTINADGNVSITAGDTVTKGNAFGIWNKDYNLIKAGGDVSVTATSANGMAQGIYNKEEGESSIEAESVEITANAGDAARGIYIDSTGVNSIKADENVSITAYSANASAWGISNYGENSIEAGSVDITASTGGAAWGIYNIASDSITADGNVSIEATSASESAWGISNYGENSIEAGSLDITASAENNATGIEIASDSNSITAAGNVSIEAISVSGSAWGISNSGENSIEAGSLDITANAAYFAIGAANAGSNSITADGAVIITADATSNGSTDGLAYGIYNEGENSIEAGSLEVTAAAETLAGAINNYGSNSITAAGNVSIEAISVSDSAWGISNSGDNSIEAGSLDITANAAYYAIGAANAGSNSITADGAVIITADATSNGSTDGLAYGIYNEGENSIEAGSLEIAVSAANYAAGIGNIDSNTINADSSVSIAASSANNKAYGIDNEGSDSVNIITAAGEVSIAATSESDEAYGIQNSGDNSITAGSLDIAVSAYGQAGGINNTGDNGVNNITVDGEVSIAATSANGGAAGVINGDTNNIDAGSVQITTNAAGNAISVYNVAGSNSITADGSISVTADSDNGDAYGLYIDAGENTIEAGSLEIAVSADGNAEGIKAVAANTIDADENVSITANSVSGSAWGIAVEGNNSIEAGSVEINVSGADQALGISNEYSNSINSITADENVSITAASDSCSAWGIVNTGESTITAEAVDITASSEAQSAYAALNSGDAAMVIDADSINITASALASAYAVGADGSSSDDVVSSITLGNDNSDIIVNVTTEEDAAVGILACAQGAEVTVNGESLAVNSTATGDGLAVGLHVENYTQDETASANAAHLVINAQNTTVTSDDTGLSAVSNGQMDINGNLTVDADQVINMSGYSTMNVNVSGENTVVLNGDIVFDAVNPTQGVATISDATLNLNLTDADSSWTGNTYTTYYKDSTSTDVTGFSLSLSNGASWNVTDVSDKYTDDGSVVVAKLAVNELTSDGGIISLTDGGTAAVEDITLASGGLTLNAENDGGELEYETMTGDGGLTKTGDGTVTISGTTAYTGATTVEAGTLDVGSITLASEELTIYSGATFASAAEQNFSTLNVNAAEGGTATYDGNLSVTDGTLNFITSVAPDAALLTVTGDADVSGSAYNIGVYGGTQIDEGTTLTLIETDGTLTSTGLTAGDQVGTIKIGSTIAQVITADLSVANNGSALTAVTEKAAATEYSKAISESWLAGLNLTVQGADLIADKGMDAAIRAANTKDKFGGFAAVSGGRNRYDSGSSIDMDNFNLLAGFAGIKEMKKGRLAVGAFYEYGDGSYDTYNSFNGASLHGDGDAHYYGGGVLARMDFAETSRGHSYAEFSGRVGRLHNDYDNSGLLDASGRAAAFDSKTTYYGFHVGGGYEWELSEKTSLDVYGRYFWTRQDGDSVTLSTGESVEFDAANSSRLRIGARAKFAGSRNVRSYAGLAWEHEFDGEANATTNGYRISSPSLKGDTGIAEAGITITPNADVPFDIDINLQGYIGKREGFVGGVAFKWFF